MWEENGPHQDGPEAPSPRPRLRIRCHVAVHGPEQRASSRNRQSRGRGLQTHAFLANAGESCLTPPPRIDCGASHQMGIDRITCPGSGSDPKSIGGVAFGGWIEGGRSRCICGFRLRGRVALRGGRPQGVAWLGLIDRSTVFTDADFPPITQQTTQTFCTPRMSIPWRRPRAPWRTASSCSSARRMRGTARP